MRKSTLAWIASTLIFPILIGCGGGGGGLSDPGLSNIQVETGNARAAIIGPDGGTITVTGSNGFVYTLTVPPGAVQVNTKIAVYPIQAIKNLPAGGSVIGGVNFAPEGLQLSIPATLTIQLPASIDPKKAVPVAYTGNGENLHLDLGTASGQTITTQVEHFSGTALGGRTIADLLHATGGLTNTTTQFQHRMADAFWRSEENNTSPLADYNLILRNWYDLIVHPKLIAGGQPNSTFDQINKAISEYNAWLDGILYAQRTLGDPAYNIQPENSDSEPLEVLVIKRWYQFYNDLCVRDKNNALDAGLLPDGNIGSPLDAASEAMVVGFFADYQHIPRAANGLDKATLLNNLCVKVVIESKSYDGTKPETFGTLKVKAGFTIDGGTPRHDAAIQIKISGNGSVISGGPIGTVINGDLFTRDVAWPQGVDPLIIDILASLKNNSDIAVFDEIKKSTSGNGGGGGGGGGTFLDREYVGTLLLTGLDGVQETQPGAHVKFQTINFGAEGPHLAMIVKYGPGLNFGFSQYVCSSTTNSFVADTGDGPRCTNTYIGTVTDANHVSTMAWSFTLPNSTGAGSFSGTANF